MQRSSSFGTSWADQWDTGADPSPRGRANGGGGKKKQGSAVEKTKAAASTGLRKVKEGTANGFQWIKEKYQNQKKKGSAGAGAGDGKNNEQGGAW